MGAGSPQALPGLQWPCAYVKAGSRGALVTPAISSCRPTEAGDSLAVHQYLVVHNGAWEGRDHSKQAT
jgi:hypothetical protein